MGEGTYYGLYELEILVENLCTEGVCSAEEKIQGVGV